MSGLGRSPRLAYLQYVDRVTDRATLVAKCIVAADSKSMVRALMTSSAFNSGLATPALQAAAGYHLRFRQTRSSVLGMVDTYGAARVVVEREPISNVRVGFSAHMAQPEANKDGEMVRRTTFGFNVQVGALAPIQAPLTPCTSDLGIYKLNI